MAHQSSPEQIELDKKTRVLERLKDRLADREEELADLNAEIEQFEARYTTEVARFYAEWDEIEAQIAEEEAKLVPDDEEIKKRAEELRRKAEESAADVDAHSKAGEWKPTAEAKKAYHDLAKIIHPDLALDETEKARRHGLMAQLNQAYSSGDQKMLKKLAEDFRDAPELVTGDTVADRLVRAIRQIYQVKNRLYDIESEFARHEASEHYILRLKVVEEEALGRDLLKQMGNRARTHISKSSRRLATLKNLNVAQEEYVKETFGMDINEFRK